MQELYLALDGMKGGKNEIEGLDAAIAHIIEC